MQLIPSLVRRIALLLATACVIAPVALPYVRTRNVSGPGFVTRRDFANVQFLLNEKAVPGLTNSDGSLIITPDSDVMAAVQAAIATWNSVATSAARFAPVQNTAALNGVDSRSVIVFGDSPAIRSLFGANSPLTAITLVAASGTNIVDTDIVFNPSLTYSTTGAPNTVDIQAALTKQLGNALGADNSGVLGASLFLLTPPNSTVQRTLSPDDIAFVSGVYPAAGLSPYGTLAGTLTLNGSPLRNALISAVDNDSGTAFCALSDSDGTWSVVAPPGTYVVYAQPLNGPIFPYFFGSATGNIDTDFEPGLYGGNGSQTAVAVTANATSIVDFSPPTTASSPPLSLFLFNAARVGAAMDVTISPGGISRPTQITSGQTLDVAILGPGIDASLPESSIILVGPLSLQPGSLRQDSVGPFNINGAQLTLMRFTVNVQAVSAQTEATLLIVNNGSMTAYTGGIVLEPPTQ